MNIQASRYTVRMRVHFDPEYLFDPREFKKDHDLMLAHLKMPYLAEKKYNVDRIENTVLNYIIDEFHRRDQERKRFTESIDGFDMRSVYRLTYRSFW